MVIVSKEYVGLAAMLLLVLIALYFITDAFLDLINKFPSQRKDSNKMTDLEKFEALFDDMGIEYKTMWTEDGRQMNVSPECMCCNYGYGLIISFGETGNFRAFYPNHGQNIK